MLEQFKFKSEFFY